MKPLRVVTLWRPWDFAIVRLDKRVENRDWRPPLECPWYMAVRGGQRYSGTAFLDRPREGDWPAGYVSGVAEVVRYEPPGRASSAALDRWRDFESWGWMLGRVAVLPEPVLWPPKERHPEDKRTMQGLVSLNESWPYDVALLEALRAAWGRAPGRVLTPDGECLFCQNGHLEDCDALEPAWDLDDLVFRSRCQGCCPQGCRPKCMQAFQDRTAARAQGVVFGAAGSPRHAWELSADRTSQTCRRCGVQRYRVEGSPAVLNYEWPDGRKQAVPKNGRRCYVPPCEGKR